jgi:peptidoglycan/xylan/chitin deacetylase (PgdA/CDA1 family)
MADAPSRNLLRSARAGIAPMAKTALLHTGGYAAIRALAPSRYLAILRYHAICGAEGYGYADPQICITPENFERHVAYLSRSYSVVRLDDATARIAAGEPLPANAVAITFDDGYADNLQAARILAKYGATATFYITAGCLAGGLPFWPSEIRHLVAAIRAPRLRLAVAGVELDLPLESERDRVAAVKALTKAFKSNLIPIRDELREQLRRFAGSPDLPRIMLTWDEVREMHRLGMTIGSHTMTHPNLPSAGPEAARAELKASRQRLEQETQAPVTMFSYPNGGADRYLNADVQTAVKETGYRAATTSRNAFATTHSDLYALERIEVEERLEDLVFALELERFAFKPQPRSGERQGAGGGAAL